MKRKAFIIKRSSNGNKAICIDSINAKFILNFLNQDKRHKKKFRYITDLVLRGIRNTELYDKENINKKSRHVTAMKFFKGQENARIYCKEQRIDNQMYVIICCELVESKKTKRNNKKIRATINKISNYEYQIEK